MKYIQIILSLFKTKKKSKQFYKRTLNKHNLKLTLLFKCNTRGVYKAKINLMYIDIHKKIYTYIDEKTNVVLIYKPNKKKGILFLTIITL